MNLYVLGNKLSVCQLNPSMSVPDWAQSGDFYNLTRTSEELSIVCSTSVVPSDVKSQDNWRGIKIEGPLDFSLTGILSSLLQPLADAKISIFAISTFNTDYILIQEKDLEQTISTLSIAGHSFK